MTSGVTERDRAKADRQAAILHEAARLFAERGFSGVSLEELGAAVDVSGPGGLPPLREQAGAAGCDPRAGQ